MARSVICAIAVRDRVFGGRAGAAAGRRRPGPGGAGHRGLPRAGGRRSGVMPAGRPAHEEPAPGSADTERAAGIRFWSPRRRSGTVSGNQCRTDHIGDLRSGWRDTASAVPAPPDEPGPAAGRQGTIQAGPRPRPGPGLPVVPPDLTVRGLPPLRTRPVRARAAPGASHEPFCPVAARLRITRAGGLPLACWPQQGRPAIFRRAVMRPFPGPVRLFPDWKRRPAEKAPDRNADWQICTA